MKPITIGITFGDIAGIGPEVILKALSRSPFSKSVSFIFFGDFSVFKKIQNLTKVPWPTVPFSFANHSDKVSFKKKDRGKSSKTYGKLAIQWIEQAVLAWKNKQIDALVTAPINKTTCRQAGFRFKGHTDFLASFFDHPPHRMMFISNPLRVLLVTHHQSLASAIKTLTTQQILQSIEIGHQAMQRIGITKPHLKVCGLNPHAGEKGAFGHEEIKTIQPAIRKAQKKGWLVSGPYPSDSLFHQVKDEKKTLVIAHYHDQGLIPFKLLAFDQGVNVTTGLPLIRTSPDHGTAYDIAWKGMANEGSMQAAIRLAIQMARSQKT